MKNPSREKLIAVELAFGCFTFPTSIFATEAEARDAWRKYRAHLLEAAEPGERPRAYYIFELGVKAPARSFDQLSPLLDRALIGDEEAMLLDIQPGLYAAVQGVKFCSAFESTAGVRAQGLGRAGLRYLRGEFETAARWHGWRSRPELEAKYKRLAAIVEAVIEGREEL